MNLSLSRVENTSADTSAFSAPLWFATVVLSALGAFGVFNEYATLSWVFGVLVHYQSLKTSRRILPIIVLLLFNLLFYVYAMPHIFWNIDLINMPIAEARPYIAQTLWQIGLMSAVYATCVSLFARKDSPVISFVDISLRMNKPRAIFLFYLLMAAILLASLFFIKGESIFGKADSYSLYVENLSSGSGLPEYLLLLFFIAALLIKSKTQRFVWYSVMALYAVILSSFGLRVVVLMGAILALWFSRYKFSAKKIIMVFAAGYFVFSLLGLLKVSSQSEYWSSSIFYERHEDNLVSHHGNVLWASCQMLRLIDENIIDYQIRTDFAAYLALNALIPSSIVQQMRGGYLGAMLQQSGYTSGGGHATTYAFIALSVPGIILLGVLLAYGGVVSLSTRAGMFADAVRCWFMFVLVTFPRWISYDIGNFFFRLPIYAAFLYLGVLIATRSRAGLKHRN